MRKTITTFINRNLHHWILKDPFNSKIKNVLTQTYVLEYTCRQGSKWSSTCNIFTGSVGVTASGLDTATNLEWSRVWDWWTAAKHNGSGINTRNWLLVWIFSKYILISCFVCINRAVKTFNISNLTVPLYCSSIFISFICNDEWSTKLYQIQYYK